MSKVYKAVKRRSLKIKFLDLFGEGDSGDQGADC